MTMHPQRSSLSQSPSTTAQSQFCLNGRRFNLTTSCSVSIVQQSQDSGLKFISCPCEMVGNQLLKYFRITYKDTVIYVEDKITIDSPVRNFEKQQSVQRVKNEGQSSENIKNASKNKKMILFKYNSLKNADLNQKIDKKNIVKNVVNAFYKYLKEGKLGAQVAENVTETVSKLIQTKKFNNQLIASLIEQRVVRQYFKKFLILEALDWIQNSKLKIKQIYKQAVQIYEKLCNDEDRKQQKRVKISPEQGGYSSNSSINFQQLGNYDLQQAIRGFK